MTKRGLHWQPFVGAVLAAAAALLPAGSYARRYAIAQAARFALFAIVVPALLAVGWPTRSPARREHHGATPAGRASQPACGRP